MLAPLPPMESLPWVIILFLTLFLATTLPLLLKLLLHPRRPNKLPPGPKPWPVIGNLHQVGPNPHRSFHSLSKTYGPLLLLRFGSRPVVVASSPHMAELFLKTHDLVFASRPTTAAGKYTSYNYSDMLWAPYGPHWRQARQIYLTEILSPKKLETYEYILEEEKKSFIRRLYTIGGDESIKLREELTRYTLSSISRMVLGNKDFGISVRIEELQEMLDEWFFLNGVFNIGDWIPWLGFLDLQGYVKRMKGLSRKFEKFHNYVISDHKGNNNKRRELGEKEDMVDVLLKLANDPNLEVKLTNDCVKGLIQNLLAGGTDTSATTVEWAILELLKHPNILKRATQELQNVIGNQRWVQEKDFSQLPYIESIIKETLRLHPLTTLLPPHFAIENCKIDGYDIPKGTTVFVNTWSIGRDPKCWDEPEEFKPERFLGENANIDITGRSFELLPFGSGRRRCPGYRLGLKVVRSTLANLLHGFVWKLPNDMKAEDICMEEFYGLTTHPRVSLSLILEPRLPLHLY
ncbi:hypothetical protein LguiB_029546 [Lonicera macranthoides]